MASVLNKISYQKFLLLLLPAAYMFISSVYVNSLGGFYMEGPDPVYAYLFNGLNLASGHLEVGHIDHPGTPVQYFVALVIFITHLFRGQIPLVEDVLNNPELYLHNCCMTLVCILGLVVFFTGLYVYVKTGSIYKSLFFQLSPVLFADGIFHIVVPRPEALIIISGTFFASYLFINLRWINQELGWKTTIKKVIVLGVFSAFLVTTKLTCTPFFVGVFIMIRGIKNKVFFLLSVFFSGILFAFPALFKIDNIKHWVIDLMTHDGSYGSGNRRFADPETYWKNIADIFSSNSIFTVVYVLLVISIVYSLFKYKKQYFKTEFAHLSIGLFVSLSLLIIVVAKHYSFYYMMPAFCFLPLSMYVANKNFSQLNLDFLSRFAIVKYIFLVFAIFFTLNKSIAAIGYTFDKDYHNPMLDTQQKIMSYGESIPTIITSEYESSFIEPSLYFGMVYAGAMNPGYFEQMNIKYPNSFLYRIGDRKMLKWNVEYLPYEIFGKYKTMLVYFKNSDFLFQENVLNNLALFDPDHKLFEYQRVYVNEASKESLYMIECNTSVLTNLPIDTTVVFSDLESMTDDKIQFLTSDDNYKLKKADQVNTQEFHSGKNSIKLSEDVQYGMDLEFDLKEKSYLIDVTVWRKSEDGKGVIVLEPADKSFYAAGGVVVASAKNGWKQIKYRFKLPDNYNGGKVNFYIYYNGHQEAYFDDLKITQYSMTIR